MPHSGTHICKQCVQIGKQITILYYALPHCYQQYLQTKCLRGQRLNPTGDEPVSKASFLRVPSKPLVVKDAENHGQAEGPRKCGVGPQQNVVLSSGGGLGVWVVPSEVAKGDSKANAVIHAMLTL